MKCLTDYLSGAFKAFGIVISAIAAGISVSIVVYGFADDIIYIIIAGFILLIASLKGLRDSTSILNKIKNYVNELHGEVKILSRENDKLTKNVKSLDELVGRYKHEANNLTKIVKKADMKIDSMEKLIVDHEKNIEDTKSENEKFSAENHKLADENQLFSEENTTLKYNIDELHTIEELFKKENEDFKSAIKEAESKIKELEEIKEEYATQIDKFKGQLNDFDIENNELKQNNVALGTQVEELKVLYIDSKKLIKNLVLAGDKFDSFEKKFGETANELRDATDDLSGTVSDLQETANVIGKMVNSLAKKVPEEKRHLAQKSETIKKFRNLVRQAVEQHKSGSDSTSESKMVDVSLDDDNE